MALGDHKLQGTYQKDGASIEFAVHVTVEEGGILQLSTDDEAKYGYSINGFIQDNLTISFK